ncbi:pseudouridine synthase [Phenylobacterium sp.]|uniref:pseudouridine synthase n=1 Tax=Phenylobacterium sp. TaxID=1871053 RepID=UPI002736E6A2|nr:pseudouridine synthase [Phenylobacterium sp.]MDP3661217.1 pseudouridine synthase [Phenylobacterium sp.]
MIHDEHPTGDASAGQADDAARPGERVAKALARAGVASRREVERLIELGRVALNGQVLTTPAVKVEPGDILTVDGEVVNEAEPARLFRYHKPAGLVTSHSDPQGRPTVFAALPPGLPRLISVGRLDLNSEGLLLLTNDGGLARALELPASGVVRRYRARAHGRVTQDKLDRLKAGVTVEGVQYGPIDARLDKAKEGPQGANLWITVTLAEGKNREVRRVLESLGLKVNRLIRLSYGPLALGTLEVGAIEEVGPRVLREQFVEHIAPEALPKGERPQLHGARTAEGQISRGDRRREPGVQTRSSMPLEPREKQTYKPGWAKPKKPKPTPLKKRSASARPKKPAPERTAWDNAAPARTAPSRSTTTKAAPAGGRSSGDRPDKAPSARPHADRPRPGKPGASRTLAPRAAAASSAPSTGRAGEDRSGTPASRPHGERARTESSRGETHHPEGQRPGKPVSRRPASAKPGSDQPRSEKPRTDRPPTDRPRTGRPSTGRPSTDRPRPGKR